MTQKTKAIDINQPDVVGESFVDVTEDLPLSSPIDFFIQDVKVDITAVSSQAARNQAILQAQRQALQKLVAKIMPEFDETKLATLPDDAIEFMVQDFEIVHEKISNIRYMATFTIRFNPAAVKQFLKKSSGQNLSHINRLVGESIKLTTASPINNWLIIPILRNNQQKLLWEEDNNWYAQWEQHEIDKSSTIKFTLPIRDLTDLSNLSTQDALDGNLLKLDALLNRYKMTHALIAILDLSSATANIQLQGYKLRESRIMTQTLELDTPNLTEPQILPEALSKTLAALAKPNIENTAPKKIIKLMIRCEFINYGEWLRMRDALNTMPTTQSLLVKALSKNRADIQICINYDVQEVIDTMASYNYQLVKLNAKLYKLTKMSTELVGLSHEVPDDLPTPTVRRLSSPYIRPFYSTPRIR